MEGDFPEKKRRIRTYAGHPARVAGKCDFFSKERLPPASVFDHGRSHAALPDAAPERTADLYFYTSGGSFENAVSNGNVTFPNYAAGFASTATQGAIQVRNNEADAPFGYDQILMSFFSHEPGVVTAPQAGGHNLQSVEFNFYSDLSPICRKTREVRSPPLRATV
jgi:hypothetical protein